MTLLNILPDQAVLGLALAVLVLPLVAFSMLFFFAKLLPGRGDWLATALAGLGLVISAVIFYSVWGRNSMYYSLPWFEITGTGGREVSFLFSIVLNNAAAIMLLTVTLISFLVHLYSMEYMKGKRNYGRYYPYLGIFTFAMIGIVLSDNIMVTFMFWELVGFSSYLLIGFWFDKDSSMQAAKKAFLFNRIGDLGFIIALLILFSYCGSFEFSDIRSTVAVMDGEHRFWITMAGLGIFAGCVGKSAQFPLHVWLPDAMEGPTPVSALLHAATMVAAGVYLLAKCTLILSPDALTFIAYTGAVTAFAGALPAIFQNDIKKVLAYSTISQLGYMVMAIGVGGTQASLFHLLTHAFFKAGLFLAAGTVIHAMHHVKEDMAFKGYFQHFDAQDMRWMGGLRNRLPVTFYVYVVCAMSLIGVPLFSGFLSKEAILGEAFHWAAHQGAFSYIVPVLAVTGVFITAFYMTRQIVLIFFGDFRLGKKYVQAQHSIQYAHDPSWRMRLPLILLGLGSLFLFFTWNPFNAGAGWVLPRLGEQSHTEVNYLVLAASLLSVAAGMSLGWFANARKPMLSSEHENGVKDFLIRNYRLDDVYRFFFVKGGFFTAGKLYLFDNRVVDRLIDWFGITCVILAHFVSWTDKYIVDGLVKLSARVSGKIGQWARGLQGGKVQTYYVVCFLGLIALFFWIFL